MDTPAMTPPVSPSSSDQNDRVLAALAHGAVLIPSLGFLAPIIIWATQRDRSRFVAFQSLQAAIYQVSIFIFWFLFMGCYMVAFLGMIFLGTQNQANQLGPGFFFAMPFGVMGLGFLAMGLWVIYGLVAAVQCLRGVNFHYLFLGSWLSRTLK